MTAAKSVKILPLGLEFDAKAPPSFGEWQSVGSELIKAEKCLGFYIGDWLNYGEKRWGEKYKESVTVTGLDYGTLRTYAYVARAVPLSLRIDKLTFAHHRKVAPLTALEQKKWLAVAATAISKGESFGDARLARSIEAGKVIPIEKIAQPNEEKSFSTYLLQITRLRAFWRELKTSGKLPELTTDQRKAMQDSFALLEQTRSEMVAEGLWPETATIEA